MPDSAPVKPADDTLRLSPPSRPLAFRVFGRTDPGLVRPGNEDHFLVADLSRTLRVLQTSLPQPDTRQGSSHGHVLLVADGMGGHAAGEVASALTVESVEGFVLDLLRRFSNLRDEDEKSVLADLGEAVRRADARITAEAWRHPEFAGMGTTLTIAFASGHRLFVLQAGDSRCYRFRAGVLEQLTVDHTLVAEMAAHGLIRPDEVRDHPRRHIVTNVLGGNHAGVRVDVQVETVAAGDAVLLCSDGLTDMLEDARLAAILAAEPDPEKACARLVAEANEAGGRDNITVVVARWDAA